ncbi:MAG: serine/threonine-protein phosphatase [Oscillospiraceae bacterium]|nr:serine/threonine-protein phosphatase [Oscillospiraceae bacterium]
MLEITAMIEAGFYAPENDDRAAVNSVLLSDGLYSETAEDSCLVVVCDGVAGEAGGDKAAEIVTEVFSKLSGKKLSVEIIEEYIEKANDEVMLAQKANKQHRMMASTLAGLYINGDDFIAFNVGDTRIYRHRAYILQLSKDHTQKQDLIDLGKIPKPAHEHVVTRYMGGFYAFPDFVDGKNKVLDGDVFVLCSDGVWGSVNDEDFERILSEDIPDSDMCRKLIDLALKNGSDDNLTVVIVRRK